MPASCAIACCKSTKRNAPELTFHRFPKTSPAGASSRRRAAWIRAVTPYRKNAFNPDTATICSLHFEEDCWVNKKASSNGSPPNRQLTQSAVPTLRIKPELIHTSPPFRRTTRTSVEAANSALEVAALGLNLLPPDDEPDVEVPVLQVPVVEVPVSELEAKEKQLEEALEKIRALEETNASLAETVDSYEHRFPEMCVNVMLGKMGKLFTANQLKAMMSGQKRINWTGEDIAHALTLRYLGIRGYKYIRQNIGIPLPGISTLQRWLSLIDMRSGFLDISFLMLRIASAKMSSYARNVVISFDEVKVKEQYEYDTKEDELIGIHKQMQVIMVRSLASDWKQPVYVGFDQKVTKDMLFTLIRKLHDCNLNVVAMVSDMGGSNIGLWNSLNVSIEQNFFVNPVTQKKVFVFADAPHLLKLIRNWLLAYDFHKPDGSIISIKVVKTLIKVAAENAKEVSSCFKLGNKHIDVKKTEKQNVQLAAELLSHTTATALTHYADDVFLTSIEKQVAVSTAKFIELTDAWFNIMNARVPVDGLQKAYGLELQKQDAILTEYISTIQHLTLHNSEKDINSLQLFQKGVIITSKSMMGLLAELNASMGVTYILGSKLNQDCLENLYSQMRTNGGLCDHPSPLAALYRLRMIIAGKNMGTVQHHANTLSSGTEEFLMAQVLKQCKLEFDVQKSVPSGNDEEMRNESLELGNVSFESMSSGMTEVSNASQQIRNRVKEFERDGVQYLAGWVAKKLKTEFPDLGDYTYKHTQPEHGYAVELPTWTRHLSFGGLTQPTEEWFHQALALDRKFKKYSGKTFFSQKKCTESITKKLSSKFPGLHPTIIHTYARQRTFIRMNYLNAKYQEKKNQKKKAQKLKRLTT